MFSAIALVNSLVKFYSLLILVYVLLSWFPASGVVHDVRRVLASVCEPYIGLFRRIVPGASLGGAGIDFSPLVAYLVLVFIIQPVLIRILAAAGLG